MNELTIYNASFQRFVIDWDEMPDIGHFSHKGYTVFWAFEIYTNGRMFISNGYETMVRPVSGGTAAFRIYVHERGVYVYQDEFAHDLYTYCQNNSYTPQEIFSRMIQDGTFANNGLPFYIVRHKRGLLESLHQTHIERTRDWR